MSRVTLSIFGGSGCGKSTLAKRLADRIGPDRAVRVPTDYFLESNPYGSLDAFRRRPLQYDWARLETFLAAEDGVSLTTPDYDFEHFQRISVTGGRSLVMRPIAILDGMRPYPKADMLISLEAPELVRKKRIQDRDCAWGTRVIENWSLHQVTMQDVFRLQYPIDLQLDGLEPTESQVDQVLALLGQRGMMNDWC